MTAQASTSICLPIHHCCNPTRNLCTQPSNNDSQPCNMYDRCAVLKTMFFYHKFHTIGHDTRSM